MSVLLERSGAAPDSGDSGAAGGDPTAWDAVQRSRGPRLRADLRLARRQLLRAWPVSLLVAALIAAPMMLVGGAIVFAASHAPTDAETLTAELGRTDTRVNIVSGPDPTLTQYLDQPSWWEIDRDADGMPVNDPEPLPESAIPFLPAGLDPIEIGTASVTARTATGVGPMTAVIGDAGDPALTGRFSVVAGSTARGDDEAMVSPGALQRLGLEVGDTLELTDPSASFTITGVMTRAEDPDAANVLFLPGTTELRALQTEPTATSWYLAEWSPTAADVAALNHQGITVLDRHLYVNPGSGAAPDYGGGGAVWSMVALGAAGAAFCAYLVIMLAGAAFSVSARRQQRSLAVAASVGASRGDIFRVVVLQGTVLGVLGGAVGAAAGVGLGILFLHLLDDGSAGAYWGLHVPWWALVGVVVFAALVGTGAALIPARSASRGEVIAALRGARRPVRLQTRRPLWGTLLIVVGVGITVVAGLGLAALTAPAIPDYSSPLFTVCVIGIVGGPILLQVGVILAGHWLLTLIARALSKLGLAPRIAGRDAAANPSRVVPAFGAIAAVAFLASASLGGLAASMGSAERGWFFQAPMGSVVMTGYINGPGLTVDAWSKALESAEQDARAQLSSTEPAAMGTVWSATSSGTYDDQGMLGNPDESFASPRLQDFVDCATASGSQSCDTAGGASFGYAQALTAVDEDDLATTLGMQPTQAMLAAFRSGGAIVTDPRFLDASGSVEVGTFTFGQQDDYYQGSDTSPQGPPAPTPTETRVLPAVEAGLPAPLPWAVIVSPATADDLGVRFGGFVVVAAYDVPPPVAALDALREDAQAQWATSPVVSMYPYQENGPPDPAPWLWLILGATSVLVVGASGIALGLARVERRPDDATLAAVGGTRALRRGIAFWQAAVIAGVGALTGAVAGILPVWGVIIASQGSYSPPLLSDLPWAWLALLGLGLPLAIAVVSWLVPPRHPDLTRRTAIA